LTPICHSRRLNPAATACRPWQPSGRTASNTERFHVGRRRQVSYNPRPPLGGKSFMLRRTSHFIALSLTAVLTVGCYSPYMRWPDLYHPGTAEQQRAIAEQFDPYPSPDTGPEVVGGRPLGYTRPLTEEEWGRRYARPDGALQPIVVPTLPTAPVFTTPYPPSAPPVPAMAPPLVSPSGVQPRSPY
jgi:hypothetical protein